MSADQRDVYYHDPFQRSSETLNTDDSTRTPNHQTIFHDYIIGTGLTHFFTDYNNTPATTFGYSSSSSSQPLFSLEDDHQKPENGSLFGVTESTTPVTPNSSSVRSSSSTDQAAAAADEHELQQGKMENPSEENGGDSSKKLIKQKRQIEEKKKREPRFAFMTKTDNDHLEDGYRWRKYGQKAVKNSPYPRSYYRCTTQKCTVKKRVERSYQDPSTVITTYEGQHNHHLPPTLRGNIGGGMLMAAQGAMMMMGAAGGSNFPHGFYNFSDGGGGSIYQPPIDEQLEIPDYGLLQDMVPSMIFKQEP